MIDGRHTIIRVRFTPDGLREVKNYADFANDPPLLAAIRAFLASYRPLAAQFYTPGRLTLVVERVGTIIGLMHE